MHPLLEELRRYAAEHQLSRRELAARLGVPYSTVKGWLGPRPKARLLTASEQRIQALLGGAVPLLEAAPLGEERAPAARATAANARLQAEAKRRAAKLKLLLVLLEDELRWFRDGHPDGRAAYRATLDPYDIGYLSSLLSMLTDEEKFQRWRVLTTHRFRSFRKRARRDGAQGTNSG
ncbi:MAG: hypothetical protein HY330_00280 [Chloroflexi bacterium]|nr:hypothetical protein [Chloroflexota bacterium]